MLKHSFTSTITGDVDPGTISPEDWNADHTVVAPVGVKITTPKANLDILDSIGGTADDNVFTKAQLEGSYGWRNHTIEFVAEVNYSAGDITLNSSVLGYISLAEVNGIAGPYDISKVGGGVSNGSVMWDITATGRSSNYCNSIIRKKMIKLGTGVSVVVLEEDTIGTDVPEVIIGERSHGTANNNYALCFKGPNGTSSTDGDPWRGVVQCKVTFGPESNLLVNSGIIILRQNY